MREARQAVAAMRAALRQTTVRPLISLIKLRRTLVRAPDVCHHHVRSRVMEPGRNRGALNMHVGLTMFPTDYSIPPHDLAVAAAARGYDSLWLPEHSHIPTSRNRRGPAALSCRSTITIATIRSSR